MDAIKPGSAIEAAIPPEFDNVPPGTTMAADDRRCWRCDAYSFKTEPEDDGAGKCYVDRGDGPTAAKVYWVAGNMVCPRFELDPTETLTAKERAK